MSSSDERAAFEAWAQENAYDLTPSEANERGYWYGSTAIAWAAWQARATAPQSVKGDERDMRAVTEDREAVVTAERAIRNNPSATLSIIRRLQTALDEARAAVPQAGATLTDEQIASVWLRTTGFNECDVAQDVIGFARALLDAQAEK